MRQPVVDKVKEPAERRPEEERLAEFLDEVRQDAARAPEVYARDSVVPEGGE